MIFQRKISYFLSITTLGVVVLSSSMFSGGAVAQNARYQLEPTQNGYIRLDRDTGVISVCERQELEMVCKLAQDDALIGHKALEELSQRIENLEKHVQALEESQTAAQKLPDEQQFERTMDYMERFLTRFGSIVKNFNEEEKASATPKSN